MGRQPTEQERAVLARLRNQLGDARANGQFEETQRLERILKQQMDKLELIRKGK